MLELSGAQTGSMQEMPSLSPDEIHLWFCGNVLRACNLLSNEELNRSTAIQQRQQAHHFIFHQLIAAYLSYPIKKEDILRTYYGKPYITNHLDLQFNLSHTEGTFIAAFSRSYPIGVDLESCRQLRPYLELAERFFSKNEHDLILSVNTAEHKNIFLQLWTAKEALLKAYGTGISSDLDHVKFTLDSNAILQISQIPAEFGTPQEWQFVQLRHTTDFVGALAWRGKKCKISIFEVDEIL